MRTTGLTKIYMRVLMLLFISINLYGQSVNSDNKDIDLNRTNAYEKQLEEYFKLYLVDDYEIRSVNAWHRDYSSPDALLRSVEPNRRRWQQVLKPPFLRKSGSLIRSPYVLDGIHGEWIELPLGKITAQAALFLPQEINSEIPVPLVIVQHGINGSPESTFMPDFYHEYAKAILKEGFAVLIPMNLRSVERRNKVERYARLAGTSLPGIEMVRVQNLLDIILGDSRIDSNRVGMWGLSLGGMATMFWMPLEPRIKVGIVSGWFNERRNKMVVNDSRYSSFSPKEEHAFFNGWLSEFSDYDLVSLIAPRPLMIQHGKTDRIAFWPQVLEEYNKAKVHYEKLNIPNSIKLILHEGGHEVIVEDGIRFMKLWL